MGPPEVAVDPTVLEHPSHRREPAANDASARRVAVLIGVLDLLEHRPERHGVAQVGDAVGQSACRLEGVTAEPEVTEPEEVGREGTGEDGAPTVPADGTGEGRSVDGEGAPRASMADGPEQHEAHRVPHPEGDKESSLPREPECGHQRTVPEVLLALLCRELRGQRSCLVTAVQEGLDVCQRLEPLGTAPEAFHRRAPRHPHLATLERQESHDTELTGSNGKVRRHLQRSPAGNSARQRE